MNRLALRKIGMDPEAVSSLEIGDFGNWQSDPCALDANIDLGPDQVEGGVVGVCRIGNDKGKSYKRRKQRVEHMPDMKRRSPQTHYSPFTA